MKKFTSAKIKESVNQIYGDIALGYRKSCCDFGTIDVDTHALRVGYSESDVLKTNNGSNLGLGCGNPFTIASLKKGETVLDLGSGAGFDCFLAAEQVGPEGNIIGVDMTLEMIRKAEENARNLNVQNVQFILGDIENLPIEDETVDVVISNCVINLVPDKRAAYNEMYRVLKDDGRIAISDIVLKKELPREIAESIESYVGCVSGAVTIEELMNIIRGLGFSNIKIEANNSDTKSTSDCCSDPNIDSYISSVYIQAVKTNSGEIENSMSSKKYFDQVAHRWDSMRTGFFSEEVRETAYARAQLNPGSIAADIGAGTGFITEGLLRRNIHVIAVDQSIEMIEQMKKKFSTFDNFEGRVGFAEQLPIADNTVDFAFANMYLHHTEVPLLAIKEMVRILKPGGKLVISDLDEHNFEFLRTEQHDRWMGFKKEDIKQWFQEAGLQNIEIDCAGANCCSKSNSSDAEANVSIFIAIGFKV